MIDQNDSITNYFYTKFKKIPNKQVYYDLNEDSFNDILNSFKHNLILYDGSFLLFFKFGIIYVIDGIICYYYNQTKSANQLKDKLDNCPVIEQTVEKNSNLYTVVYMQNEYCLCPLSYESENKTNSEIIDFINSKENILFSDKSVKSAMNVFSDKMFIVLPDDIILNFNSAITLNFLSNVKNSILLIETNIKTDNIVEFQNSLLANHFNFKIIIKYKNPCKIGY